MNFKNLPNYKELPDIGTYFTGHEIFITGGSGFMGKALIEKILRCSPYVNFIYVLLRSKKNKNCDERLAELKNNSIFDRLKMENPDVLNKIIAIDGDVLSIGLGLSSESLKKLENVTMIFHAAASVRFDEPLKDAIIMNTRGTREVMLFAEKLKKLILCMHVSTTYCNPNQDIVEEKLYEAPVDWKTAIKLAETLDEEFFDILTLKYMKNHPNTYTFTKALAEQVVNDFKNKIPVVIYRPSIVVSTIDEPVPGWLDNFNGPIGLLIACAIGLMRTIYSNPDTVSDYTPCDIAIKAMLAVAWKHGILNQKNKNLLEEKNVEVYNCCTSSIRSITMGQMIEIGKEIAPDIPFDKLIWAPGGSITNNRFLNFTKVIFFHILPAIFLDFGLKWSGQKQFVVKLQRRIYTANMALEFFILRSWNFDNTKFMELNKEIKPEDQNDFCFDSYRYRDVRMYLQSCCLGARRYLLKEKDENLPKAKLHFMRMYYIDKFVRILFWFAIGYFIFVNYLSKTSGFERICNIHKI